MLRCAGWRGGARRGDGRLPDTFVVGLHSGAMIVQDSFRRYLSRIHKMRTECAIKIQRVYRGRCTRQVYKQHSKARDIRLNHAARVIQRRYRKWAAKRRRRDTFGLTAQVQTDFTAEVVEEEAKRHDGLKARQDAAKARERRSLERQDRQQVCLGCCRSRCCRCCTCARVEPGRPGKGGGREGGGDGRDGRAGVLGL